MNKDLTSGNPQTVLWRFCMPLFGSIIFVIVVVTIPIIPVFWAQNNQVRKRTIAPPQVEWTELEGTVKK